MPVRRCNRRHGIPDVAHRVIENEPWMGTTATRPLYLGIFGMRDCLYTGQFFCLRSIDADDFRMGVRTAQDARVKHAGKLNIAGVLCLAGDTLVGIDAWDSFADNGKFFLSLCHGGPPLARF